MALAMVQCDGCGKVDDDPKHHYGDETYHHDCTPYRVIEDMTHVTQYGRDDEGALTVLSRTPISEKELPEHTKRFLHARKLAQDGTRGAKLRKHLTALKPLED